MTVIPVMMLFHSHTLCMPFYCIKLTITMFEHRNKDALKQSTSALVKDPHTEYKTVPMSRLL